MKDRNKCYNHCKNCTHGRYSYYNSKEETRLYLCKIKHKYFKHFFRLRAKYCDYFEYRSEKEESSYEPKFKPKPK